MPALITHHLFGEESIDRLPQGVITSDEERIAFILGNQGPDPFFFHMLTPRISDCTLLAQVMHRSRMSRQFSCLRDGVSHLQPRDANLVAPLRWACCRTMCSTAMPTPLSTSSSLALLSPTPSSRLRAVKFTPCSKATWTC